MKEVCHRCKKEFPRTMLGFVFGKIARIHLRGTTVDLCNACRIKLERFLEGEKIVSETQP